MSRTQIDACLDRLDAICRQAIELEREFSDELANVHPDYAESARNLVHYLALRSADIRDLQEQLGTFGLSTLSACETHVLASLMAVRNALARMSGRETMEAMSQATAFAESELRLEKHAGDLLGSNPDGRLVEIMVTLPSEAAQNYQLVLDLLAAGTDAVRINFAHDSYDEWLAMVRHVRKAGDETGKRCRILMDLSGPRVRTGALAPGPGVLRIRPRRDGLGRVISPRRMRFIADDASRDSKKQSVVPVPKTLLDYATPGDVLRFRDTRGRHRRLNVVAKDEKSLTLESHKRAYLATGTTLRLTRTESGEKLKFRVGQLPPIEQPIVLRVGDLLLLDDGKTPGEPALLDKDGSTLRPAHIACMPTEILSRVAVGAPVLVNDGKIEATVETANEDGLLVRITHAKPTGSRLRSNRSINFPGSDLQLRGLTDADRANLDFASAHADAVGLSFVRTPADVLSLQDALRQKADRPLGIVPKIETEEAFHALPSILLASMRSYPTGIMIARGDLAVECGWERLAEIQEEILWMCEAAQVPVIWATQVLEGKAKKGLPSRAEVTDAAMAQRADCVMLNKGPHIVAAIRMLDDILRRMQDHQYKKAPTLRKLSISDLRPSDSSA